MVIAAQVCCKGQLALPLNQSSRGPRHLRTKGALQQPAALHRSLSSSRDNKAWSHSRISHPHFAIRIFFAASSSLRFAASTFGYDNLRLSNVSTNTVDTTSRVNHLLSAGTTYHGAASLAVFRIISSYAA